MASKNEQLKLFKNGLTSAIDHLTASYDSILTWPLLDNRAAAASDTDFTLPVRSLNGAIDLFKKDMHEYLALYISLRDADAINEQMLAKWLNDKLAELHSRQKKVSKKIAEKQLKEILGKNYFFHSRLSKLKAAALFEYFESNYLMRRD